MFGVEPICTVLRAHGVQITHLPLHARSRRLSKRAVRDAEVVKLLAAARVNRFTCRFGAPQIWLHLRRNGHDVARCTVERLMAAQGWSGALRGKKIRTTIGAEADPRPADLVERDFTAICPNQLRVADFTYVAAWSGTVHLAFVFDVYSGRVVGWRAAAQMSTELVLDTLEHAIWSRCRESVQDLAGLVHHTDAGSQYTPFAFTSRLIEPGMHPSVGSVGGCLRQRPAESQIGIYTTELIRPEGPWRDVDQVELATLAWVTWFNTERTDESIDDLTRSTQNKRTTLHKPSRPDRVGHDPKCPETPGGFRRRAGPRVD